jgi:DNA invertase Pin-like site-specific DNA recombinase
MKIGYARVSSNTQDLEMQKQELINAGCVKIFSESISGKDNNRSQLMAMLDSLRADDIVVVYKIDRMASITFHKNHYKLVVSLKQDVDYF